ncbi:MAG: glycosyl hydrolase family 65 protein, partial [Fimbriimonadaceae bacterium]
GWALREMNCRPDKESARATVFALANGYLGHRCAWEELDPAEPGIKGTYVGGLYDTPEGKLTEREIVNFPDWTYVKATIDGEPLDLTTGEVLRYHRDLDMRGFAVRRVVRWKSPKGKVVKLHTERAVDLTHLHRAYLLWHLEAEQECEVTVVSGIEGKVGNRWADHLKQIQPHAMNEVKRHMVTAKTTEPGYQVAVATEEALEHVNEGSQVLDAAVERPTGTRAASEYRQTLKPGEALRLSKVAAIYENRFSEGNPADLAQKDLDEAKAELPFTSGVPDQTNAGAPLWQRVGIEIDGDEDAQMGIRFSQFALLVSAPRHSDLVSIPARGLQGQDYYGSIFWDCEMFVFPMFAYCMPEAARNMVGYRIHTLPGAQRKAKKLGFEGAYYAWQSQETGDDQCDTHVFSDPRTGEMVRSYFYDEQIHISADVVYGAWQYYEATGDAEVWTQGAAKVAFEVARFFRSRAEWNEPKQRYELNTVLGPDEYHERVDNDAYTNWLAWWAVGVVLRLVELLSHEECLILGLKEGEARELSDFRDKLYRPMPDEKTWLIEQFEGYFGLKDEPVEETRKRLAHPDLHPGGPNGPFQETQNIKQADVVMLLYVLRDRFDTQVKVENWQYYEPRTSHDSSLSPMAYSLVAGDVGRMDWAYKYFIYTSHIDLGDYGPHWNLGVHAASLGGAWLAIVHGFCKLRLAEDGVKFDNPPRLPEQWSGLRVPFEWHGVPMLLRIAGETVIVENRGDKPVPVFATGKPTEVGPGESIDLML